MLTVGLVLCSKPKPEDKFPQIYEEILTFGNIKQKSEMILCLREKLTINQLSKTVDE